MRLPSARRIALMLAPLGAAGCALLVSLDGTTGGAGADAAAEGGEVDVSVADGPDATGEEQPADSPAEGSPSPQDSGPDSPYPPGSWCAMQAPGMTFCDDFDEETTAFERWTAVNFDVGQALFSTTNVSPPRSFELLVPQYSSSTYFVTDLEETLPARPASSQLSFTFDFQPIAMPDGGPGGSDVFVTSVAQGQKQAPRSAFALRVGPGGAALQEQVTDSSGTNTFYDSPVASWMPAPGAWLTMSLLVDYPAHTVTLSVNGTTATSLTLQGPDWSVQAPVNLFLGNWFITSTPGYEVLYDDVVVRQP